MDLLKMGLDIIYLKFMLKGITVFELVFMKMFGLQM